MQEMRSILFYRGFYFHVLPQFCPKKILIRYEQGKEILIPNAVAMLESYSHIAVSILGEFHII